MIKIFLVWLMVVFVLISFTHFVKGEDYSVSVPIVKVVTEEDTFVKNTINILGEKGESFSIVPFSGDGFIFVSPKVFVLDSQGAGSFDVTLDGTGLDPGVYVGKVTVEGETDSSEIPVIFEIETFSPLFDVAMEVSAGSSASPGGSFEVDFSIYKLKGEGDRVVVNYLVRDLEGDVILSETQHLDVVRQVKMTRSFEIPDDALGDYVVSVSVTDAGRVSTGTASELFAVAPLASPGGSVKSSISYLYVSFAVIFALVIVFLVFNHFWNKKVITEAKGWNKKLIEIKNAKFSDAAKQIRRLNHQKNILEVAYKKGYVKRSSYGEGRTEINKLIRKAKKRL